MPNRRHLSSRRTQLASEDGPLADSTLTKRHRAHQLEAASVERALYARLRLDHHLAPGSPTSAGEVRSD